MTIKKLKILSIVFIFIISFITHNIYEIFPNIITSFFFPVNESIFEHMKMIVMSYILWSIIEFILLNKYKLNIINFKASIVISIILNIIIFLSIYIPIYNLFGYNTILTLLIYFLSILITQAISYKVLISNKPYVFLNKYCIIIILLLILTFTYLTYYPLKNNIFIDNANKKLGLNNYY